MHSNKRNLAIFALILTNIIWGAASPIFKLALENIPPFTLAFFRFFGASLLLLPFTIKSLRIARSDWFQLFLLSIFGITINIAFFFLGLKLAPSINAPIIASSGPIFIYLFSILVLKEKAHRRIFYGILVSLIGVLIVIGQPILSNQIDGEIVGNAFFLLATLGAVGHALVSKQILHKYKALTITFWSFVIGAITFLPFFSMEIMKPNGLPPLDARGILGLIFGIFFSSAAAYLLFEWGVSQLEAQEVGIFTYVDPVIATIIAIPLLGEFVTPVFLIGAGLIFFGIVVAEGHIPWHPFHKLQN